MKTLLDRIDPEVAGPLQGMMQAIGGGLDLQDLAATRRLIGDMIGAMKAQAPPLDGVETADHQVPGMNGAPRVLVRLYRPADRPEALPVLLWMHGGGWLTGSIDMDDLMCAQLARAVGCAVASVDYRLAPENAFPAPLEDCLAALRWLAQESNSLRVDPGRIAVGGASAGANLAAGLALLARDRQEVQLSLQLLICPTLDDRNVLPANESRPENLFWSRANALTAWRAYLGPRFGGADVPVHAAPIRASDLTGLPPACIAAAELDMFVDDAVEYARRLMRAGVTTALHVYPGTFHAFDSIAPLAHVSRKLAADRNEALIRAFRLM